MRRIWIYQLFITLISLTLTVSSKSEATGGESSPSEDPSQLTCSNTCYYKQESFETGGAVGDVLKYSISPNPLPGFRAFDLGPNSLVSSCQSSCFSQSLSSATGGTYSKKHPVVLEGSQGSPYCENLRCYEPQNPLCLPRYESLAGFNSQARVNNLPNECGYVESLNRLTYDECFNTVQINIQGSGTIVRGKTVLCSHNNSPNIKSCFSMLPSALGAVPNKDWIFNHWESVGVTISPKPSSANITPQLQKGGGGLTAVFEKLPSTHIKVYKVVVNSDPQRELPDLNSIEAASNSFLFDGDSYETSEDGSMCFARGYRFCSLKKQTAQIKAMPASPYHFFDGWYRPGAKENILITRTAILPNKDFTNQSMVIALFRESLPPKKLTVTLEGNGVGSVLANSPAVFSEVGGQDSLTDRCTKTTSDSQTCSAQFPVKAGIFSLAVQSPSTFSGWRLTNSGGGVIPAPKCTGLSLTCDLSAIALPEGATLTARIDQPVVLTLELSNGGDVGYFGKPKQLPNGTLLSITPKKCLGPNSTCQVEVSNATGKINQYFQAYSPDAGRVFAGWQLLNEKGEDVTPTGNSTTGTPLCSPMGEPWTSCDLSSVTIGPNWKLRANWFNSPSGLIKLNIVFEGDVKQYEFNSFRMAYLSIPPTYTFYDSSWGVDSETNSKQVFRANSFSQSSRNLPIRAKTNFFTELTMLSASPVGPSCKKPKFHRWEVMYNDSTRRKLGDYLLLGKYGKCGLDGPCSLNNLSLVSESKDYPTAITAVFKPGTDCQVAAVPTHPPRPTQPQCRITGTFNTSTKKVHLTSTLTGWYSSGDGVLEGNVRPAINPTSEVQHSLNQRDTAFNLVFKFYTELNGTQPQCQTTVPIPALPSQPVTTNPETSQPTTITNSTNDPNCYWRPQYGNSADLGAPECQAGWKYVVCGGVRGCIKNTCSCGGGN